MQQLKRRTSIREIQLNPSIFTYTLKLSLIIIIKIQNSGEILKADDPRTALVGSKIYNTFDPPYFGYWDDASGVEFEYAIKSVWFILGMTPGVLAITGAVTWFIRRQRIKKRRPIPVQRSEAVQVFTENAQEDQSVTVEEREYATVQSAPAAKDLAAPKKRPWLCFSLSCVPFLIIGYVMQATLWHEGWALTETFLQHWIIKPVSIGAVVFPITTVLVIISYRAVWKCKTGQAQRSVRNGWWCSIGYLVSFSAKSIKLNFLGGISGLMQS